MNKNVMVFGKTARKVFVLDERALDEIVLAVQEYAKSMKVDSVLSARYGFLIDNALDCWLRHGGRGKEITVAFGRRLFTPYVSVEMTGERIEPYPIHSSDFGNGGNNVAVFACQLPGYEYRNGTNFLVLNLKREIKMVRQICIVAAVAIIAGIFGNVFLSETLRAGILSNIIDPIINMFFNLLRCIAGPMVFFSVVWGICGIGDSQICGRLGRAILLSSFGITVMGAIVGAFAFPLLGNGFSDNSHGGGTFSSILDMILGIVPDSIVGPFFTGNTLQIIFLAMAMGIALITMSGKAGDLIIGVDQFNNVVQYLMGSISKLVPYIVFLLITEMIWSGSLMLVLPMWKLFIAMITAFVVISVLICAFTSVKQRAGFFTVAKKNLSTFVISLTTASSAAAFSSNINAAQKRYGIADEMAGFSIPLGMIMHNPVAACYNVLLIIYFAASYGVPCSFGWLIEVIIVCTVMAISTPPIPGGATIGYALLFSQLGIPEEALAVVLVLDVVTDFIVTAFECYILPISLTNIAGSIGRLNRDILRDRRR